jgi:hypothetical protein
MYLASGKQLILSLVSMRGPYQLIHMAGGGVVVDVEVKPHIQVEKSTENFP